uniref:Uncharacterized protein n=1 Tax=Geospiza parvula TaxID=87175 RepID=A0A8C3N9W0_GEOPR
MASAEPGSEEAAEAEEAVYEEMPCDRMELSQQLAVEELISTEASYVHNMQLCVSDIRAHLQDKQLPELDLEGLFSNTDDILHVSRRFLKGLEATAGPGQEQLLCISKWCSANGCPVPSCGGGASPAPALAPPAPALAL